MWEKVQQLCAQWKTACADQYSKRANSIAPPLRDKTRLPKIYDPYQPRSYKFTYSENVHMMEIANLAQNTTQTAISSTYAFKLGFL